MQERKFNPSISIIRVLAMFLIVFGHVCSWAGIYLYQFGSLGVEIFLFISGYFYGKKQIKNKMKYLLDRTKRIMFPFWVLTFFLSMYLLFTDEILLAFQQMAEALLNLIGFSKLVTFPTAIGSKHLSAISHCWFLTIIMICYIITAIIKGSKIERQVEEHARLFLIIGIFAQIGIAFLGVQLSYILQYFIGYFFCRCEEKVTYKSYKFFVELSAVTVVLCVGRFIANRFLDNTIFYDDVIARLSFNALAIWVIYIIDFVCSRFSSFSNKVAKSKIWISIDKLSYPIYLTHYMFVKTPFNVDEYIKGDVLQVLCIIAFSVMSAIVLYLICVLIGKINNKFIKVHQPNS